MCRAVRPRERHARKPEGLARVLSLPSRLTGPASSLFPFLSGLVGRSASAGSSGRAVRPRLLLPALAAALAAAFSLPLGAGAAEAQTEVKLVGNTGVAGVKQEAGLDRDRAVRVTTGSAGGGYKVTSVDVRLSSSAATQPTYNVQIYSDTSSGCGTATSCPGTSLGTLTTTTTLTSTAALVEFTSSAGIDLASNTKYWVVIDASTSSASTKVWQLLSTAEDPHGATGWSIGNDHATRNLDNTGNWDVGGVGIRSLIIGIHGHILPWPALPMSAVNGRTLTLTFDKALDTDSVPPGDFFHVTVGTERRAVAPAGVAIDGKVVTLTLETPALLGETVKVRYRKPTNTDLFDPLQDTAGARVDTFGDQDVTNNTPDQPFFERATVNERTLTLTFTKALDETSVPAPGDFDVKVGSLYIPATGRLVNETAFPVAAGGVAVSGDTVTLTLENPVLRHFVVRADYTPGTSPLQDTDGNAVTALVDQAVANSTPDTPPAFASAAVNGSTLTVTFTEALDTASVPAHGDFRVMVDDVRRDVAAGAVAVAGDTVTLTLASAVATDETVTVGYHWGAAPLQDAAGNQVAPFTAQAVTNDTPASPPSAVTNLAAVTGSLCVVFGLQPACPVTANGSVNGGPKDGEITVNWTPSTSGATPTAWVVAIADESAPISVFVETTLTTVANLMSHTFTGLDGTKTYAVRVHAMNSTTAGQKKEATNISPGPAVTAPVLSSASVNGSTLTMVFSKDLDPASVPGPRRFHVTYGTAARSYVADGGVAVSGSIVTLTLDFSVFRGQVVKVRYTKPTVPGAKPLKDTAGNTVATFGDQAVTNLTPPEGPIISGATVSGTTLTVTFLKDLDEATAPPGNAFKVRPGSVFGTGTADVSGRTVTVTLESPAPGAEDFDYNRPAPAVGTSLRYADGAIVESFYQQALKAGSVDRTPPRLRAATVEGNVLTLTYDEALDPARRPLPGTFNVRVAGTRAHVTGIRVDGRTMLLTLDRAVTDDQDVEMSYNSGGNDAASRIQDFSGNAALSFGIDDGGLRTVTHGPPPPPTGSGGGGGGGGGPSEPSDGAPVAAAGADVAVDPGASVTLDGTGSADPDGEALSYAWTQVSGASVRLSGAATARATFTAPAAPGALVFRLTVTDPGGLTGSADVTVTVSDLAPVFGDAAVASLVLTVGEAMEAVVLPAATGGNGTLSYALTSDPAGLAGLDFDAAARTLSGTPPAEGDWVFTWRADDADANRADTDAAVLTFRVTVEDARTALVKRSVRRTLAAVGRRALTSALDNIGARFAAGVPASGLTFAGETVPLGAAGAGAGAGLADGQRWCPQDAPHLPDRLTFGQFSGPAGDGCAPVARSRGVGSDELLQASAFSLTLGAAEGSGGVLPPGSLWSVWGRGDLGTFAGRPEPGVRVEGELRTGWLGIDARSGPWVAGLAVSHGAGEADYGFDGAAGSGEGRLETELTAVYPYGRWTVADGLEVRGVVGAGRGEARHRLVGGAVETSDLTMRMASVGVRQAFAALAGFDLAARADASVARLETGAGPDYVDGLSADSWRARVGLETSRRFALDDDTALTPFVEAAARRDGGDGLEGTGLELVGGVRYAAPRFQLEARGRWLAAHTEEGAEERGVSVTARAGPGAQGRGLSLLVSPRWGAGTGGADALWRDELPAPGEAPGADAAVLDARIGYGVGLAPYGLLTPFAETGLAAGDGARRLRLGTRFEAPHLRLGVELAGEHRESDAAGPEQLLGLDLRLRF